MKPFLAITAIELISYLCRMSVAHTRLLGASLVVLFRTSIVVLNPSHSITSEVAETARGKTTTHARTASGLNKKRKYAPTPKELEKASQITGKTPCHEAALIEGTCTPAYIGRFNEAISSLEAAMTIGASSHKEVLKRERDLVALSYCIHDHARVIGHARAYERDGGKSEILPLLMACAYYKQNDYARAAKIASALIRREMRAKRIPAEDTLRLLVCCEYALKDMVAYQFSLLRLVSDYPNAENWSLALGAARAVLVGDDLLALYVDRLKRATGVVLTPSSYMDMAQLALHLDRPGEAIAALDDGYERHVLGQSGNIERQRRLYAWAYRLSHEELAQLSECARRASRADSGRLLVTLGEAYLSHENWKNAVRVLRKGLQKDLLKNPERAWLALGVAYLGCGRSDKAIASFRKISRDSARFAAIAQLWAILAEQSHRPERMLYEGAKEIAELSSLAE